MICWFSKKLHQKLLNTLTMWNLKRSGYLTHNNLECLQIGVVKSNPYHIKEVVTPNVCGISNQTISQLVNQHCGRVCIPWLHRMSMKVLMEVLPTKLPNLEEPCEIYLLIMATIITRAPKSNISNFPPGFMIQTEFAFSNVECIHGFNPTFVAICSSTSYTFNFSSRIKRSPMYTLKFIVTALRNQDNKFSFIRVDKDSALVRK